MALLILGIIGTQGPKHPDTAKPVADVANALCVVNMEKFVSLREGESLYQVERDIGCPGEQISSSRFGKNETVRMSWKGNQAFSVMTATFRNDVMVGRTQFRLK
jgi:hypothetical protein